ncbi:MAG TPA: glycosyltransferase family 4 protein [Polyangiaceae bacterium]|nr:glycosyltransferase family 4 protein [Polyangiaceae bacterium]
MPERVAVVTTSYPTSDGDFSGHFVQAEARELAARGHVVTVICGEGAPSGICSGNAGRAPPSLRVVRLPDGGACGFPGVLARLRERPRRALGLFAWMLRARRALRRLGPFDRVIAHWLLPSGAPIALTAPLAGARLEIVVHGSDARLLARLPPPVPHLVLAALQRRRALLRCVSHDLVDVLERASGAPLGAVRVDLPPIETPNVPARAAARAELGLDPERRLMVVVARLVPSKRVHAALSAARLVAPLDVVVVGDGPEARSLAQAFPEARFVGRVPRRTALTWIAAADVLVSASADEGAPTAIREARALAVPVVARRAGDLARWAEADPGLFVLP